MVHPFFKTLPALKAHITFHIQYLPTNHPTKKLFITITTQAEVAKLTDHN